MSLEDAVFELAERAGDMVHEKYLAGELTTESFQSAYAAIRLWSTFGKSLLDEIA